MAEEPDDDTAFTLTEGPEEFLPDTLSSPAGQVYFGGDAGEFLAHWLGKLGFEVEGGAVLFDENGGLTIIHPETGELLSPQQIAKLCKKPGLKSVQ